MNEARAKALITRFWAGALEQKPGSRPGLRLVTAVLDAVMALGGDWPLESEEWLGKLLRFVNRLEVNGVVVGMLTTAYVGSLVQVKVEFPDGGVLEWADPALATKEVR